MQRITILGATGSVGVRLQRQEGGAWIDVSSDVTNADGRVAALLPGGVTAPTGTYRLTFDVGPYFGRAGVEAFYSTVTIDFLARDRDAHYHVPLLLSPYGYTTYRGS